MAFTLSGCTAPTLDRRERMAGSSRGSGGGGGGARGVAFTSPGGVVPLAFALERVGFGGRAAAMTVSTASIRSSGITSGSGAGGGGVASGAAVCSGSMGRGVLIAWRCWRMRNNSPSVRSIAQLMVILTKSPPKVE